MSPKKQGFSPSPLEAETRFTFSDIQKFGSLFKQLLSESPAVKWSIIAAGIAGALETVHIAWLFGVWAYWKTR